MILTKKTFSFKGSYFEELGSTLPCKFPDYCLVAFLKEKIAKNSVKLSGAVVAIQNSSTFH